MFVTYAWGENHHNTHVISFTNFLRENGFDANVDKSINQNKSSTDFEKMMHTEIQNSDKVIIILSENYKNKAENFKGGVGREYQYILSDIDESPKKYILISFNKNLSQNTIKKIAPLAFKTRHIINLYKDQTNDFRELFSKLLSKKIIELSEVSNQIPYLELKQIPVFDLHQNSNIEKKITSVDNLLNSLIKRISSDSYFEEYVTNIKCKYEIINSKLVIKKEVKSKLILVNPLNNFLEEANFFTTYKFSKISKVKNEELLKLKKLKIKVDNLPTEDITESILINITKNGHSEIYNNCIGFEYKKIENNHQTNLIIPFEDKLVLELSEERIVPREDLIYVKRINKLTKNFKLNYSFEDYNGTIVGNCFSSISGKKSIEHINNKKNNSLEISTNNWLLPGDGIFIMLKKD